MAALVKTALTKMPTSIRDLNYDSQIGRYFTQLIDYTNFMNFGQPLNEKDSMII